MMSDQRTVRKGCLVTFRQDAKNHGPWTCTDLGLGDYIVTSTSNSGELFTVLTEPKMIVKVSHEFLVVDLLASNGKVYEDYMVSLLQVA